MNDVMNVQLANLQKQVDAKFENVKVTDFGDGPKFQHIANALDTMAIELVHRDRRVRWSELDGCLPGAIQHYQHRLFVILAPMGLRSGQISTTVG